MADGRESIFECEAVTNRRTGTEGGLRQLDDFDAVALGVINIP